MDESTIKGRASGSGTGNSIDLNPTQATAILNNFTASLKGLTPASSGGTTNFLRADGQWTSPGGGGTDTITVTFSEQGGINSGDIFQTGSINNAGWAIPFNCTVLDISVFYNLLNISFTTNNVSFSLREVTKASGQLTSGAGIERYSISKVNTPLTIYSETMVVTPSSVSFTQGNIMMLSVPVSLSFVTLDAATVVIRLKKD